MVGKWGRCSFLFFIGWILFAVVTVHAQQGSSDSAPAKNAVLEQLQVTYHFQNDGRGVVTHTVRLRILTERGLKLYGTVYSAYSSRLERLRINYLRTVKADGTVVSANPSKAMDITPPVARSAPMFSDVKIKALVAPQLQVGDEVEYQYTRTIRTPYMQDNFWAVYSLNRAAPIKSATIALNIPAGRKVSFQADPCFHYTVDKKNGRKVYEWHIENLKIPKDLSTPRPPLFAVSTLSNWKQIADWYTRLQKGGQRLSPQIKTMATKLTAGKTTPQQKLDAIYTYVSENIRYVALEFGIGGYRAHSASVVLANGYGDCKDKSNLLITLLAAAGIKAYPVLVNAVSSQFEPAVPMPSQFDHEMTVVPMDGKNVWLDSTMETAPPGILSSAVIGKKALLIETGNSRLVSVPNTSPPLRTEVTTVTGSVNKAGKLTLKYNTEANGFYGVFMRQIFRLQDKTQVAKIFKRVALYQVSGAKGSPPTSSDPDILTQPFKYQFTITKANYIDLLEKNQAVRLPTLSIAQDTWHRQIAKANKENKAKAGPGSKSGCATNPQKPIKLNGPMEIRETLNLAIPSNFQPVLPEPIQVQRPFASYTSSYNFSHGHLELQRDLKISALKIPMAELNMLKNFQELVNDDLKQKLTLNSTGIGSLLSDTSSMTALELVAAANEALSKHDEPIVARDLLLKVVAKDPKSQTAWDALGWVYYRIGNYYQAARAYKKQLVINPYDSSAYDQLGDIELDHGRFKRAIRYYKKQLSINPLDRSATGDLPQAYDLLRDWKAAASAYAVAVRVQPHNAYFYIAWGTDLSRLGKTAEGKRAFAMALAINKNPMYLNNLAFGMAQADTDLSKAEGFARSAVDQQIPGNVASLEVPKRYSGFIDTLSTFLDTLSWVIYKEGKPAVAESYEKAAFIIDHDPVLAVHLAMMAKAQNHPQAALRYYQYAAAKMGGFRVYIPTALKQYLGSQGKLPRMTAERVAAVHKQLQEIDRLNPPQGHSFTWPHTAGKAPAWVALNVLVDSEGHVTKAKVFKGSKPYSTAALHDVRQLQFPPLVWPHHQLATVRTAFFLYDPSSHNAAEKVMAFGQFGNLAEPHDQPSQRDFDLNTASKAVEMLLVEGHIGAGLEILRQEAKNGKDVPQVYRRMVLLARDLRWDGELPAAAALLRQAVPLQPKDDFAVRELAKTLKASGDRAGAIKAYQKLLKMDPEDAESHYSLATEYEAQARETGGRGTTGKSQQGAGGQSKKTSAQQSDLQKALAQYSLAEKFSPKNAVYRHAYQLLSQKINDDSSSVATHAPHASMNP